MGNKLKRIHVLYLLLFLANGLCYAQRSEIDSLKQILLEKELFSEAYQKDTSYINTLNDLAFKYIFFDIDSTYLLADKALKMGKAIDFNKSISKSLLNKGIYYSEKGESDEAIVLYEQALDKAKIDNNFGLLFDIRNNQGLEYALRGEYYKSLEIHLEGLELAKFQNNAKNISSAYNNIGSLFSVQGEYEVALEYQKKFFEYAKKANDTYFIGVAYVNLSLNYTRAEKLAEAKKTIEEGKAYFKKHGYNFLLGQLYVFEAVLLNKTKKYDLAYESAKKSIDFLTNANKSQINFSTRYRLMAEILMNQKKFEEALPYAKKAYNIAKSTNDLKALASTSETLYKYAKSKGTTTETLMYLEEFKKHSDSLFNSQNRNGILLLKSKRDFEKKQSELEAENDKILLSKQNKINTALIVIIILLCTLIPLYLKHRELNSLNHRITEKSILLESREKELVKSNNTKDKLFSIIGHDLKGPIDSLRLLLSMHQKKEVSDEEFLEFSPKLNKDVSSVFFTLTNLLNWGKSQMKGEVLQKKNFAVKPLVRDVMNFLESTSISKQLHLLNEIEREVEVYADRNQIDIVIRNILSNAIKFTPAKGTIKIISQDFENKYRISIIDNGIGMDLKTAERVLDPTETYTTYGTANEKGTGLGLILCKELVEKNKGEIWVESTLGKGSTFHILLPKAKTPGKILKAV